MLVLVLLLLLVLEALVDPFSVDASQGRRSRPGWGSGLCWSPHWLLMRAVEERSRSLHMMLYLTFIFAGLWFTVSSRTS